MPDILSGLGAFMDIAAYETLPLHWLLALPYRAVENPLAHLVKALFVMHPMLAMARKTSAISAKPSSSATFAASVYISTPSTSSS